MNNLSRKLTGMYSLTVSLKSDKMIVSYFLVGMASRPWKSVPLINVKSYIGSNVDFIIDVPLGAYLSKVKWFAPTTAMGVHFLQVGFIESARRSKYLCNCTQLTFTIYIYIFFHFILELKIMFISASKASHIKDFNIIILKYIVYFSLV